MNKILLSHPVKKYIDRAITSLDKENPKECIELMSLAWEICSSQTDTLQEKDKEGLANIVMSALFLAQEQKKADESQLASLLLVNMLKNTSFPQLRNMCAGAYSELARFQVYEGEKEKYSGNTELAIKIIQDAIETFLTAKQYDMKNSIISLEIGTAHLKKGLIFIERNELLAAKLSLEQALKLGLEESPPFEFEHERVLHENLICHTLEALSNVLSEQGQHDIAIQHISAAIYAICLPIPSKQFNALLSGSSEINQSELDNLFPTLPQEKLEIVIRFLFHLCGVLYFNGNLDKTIRFFDFTRNVIDQAGMSDNPKYVLEINRVKQGIYQATGHLKEAKKINNTNFESSLYTIDSNESANIFLMDIPSKFLNNEIITDEYIENTYYSIKNHSDSLMPELAISLRCQWVSLLQAISNKTHINLSNDLIAEARTILTQYPEIDPVAETGLSISEAYNGLLLKNKPLAQKKLAMAIVSAEKINDTSIKAACWQQAQIQQCHLFEQPHTSVFFYKMAIRCIQQQRDNVYGEKKGLTNLSESHFDFYDSLKNLLIELCRYAEAREIQELQNTSEYDSERGDNLHKKGREPSYTDMETSLLREYQAFKPLTVEKVLKWFEKIQRLEANLVEKSVSELSQKINNSMLKSIPHDYRNSIATISYSINNTALSILVAFGKETKYFYVPIVKNDFLTKIFEFVEVFHKSNREDLKTIKSLGQYLYGLLITPIVAYLSENKIKTLLLVVSNSLAALPFSALYDGRNWLVKSFATVRYPVIEGVDLKTRPKSTISIAAFGITGGDLANVEDELCGIISVAGHSRLLPNHPLTQENFTVKALEKSLEEGANIVFFATHATPNSANFLESKIMFGNGYQPIRNLQHLNFSNVDLVVLSACSSAVSSGINENNKVGNIESFFLDRGAKATIATLWPILDKSTPKLIYELFNNLLSSNHNDKAVSLQQAQLALLDDSDPKTSHPVSWGSFVLTGNWV